MTRAPLLPRQRDLLRREVTDSADNPIFVVVYDTQSIDDLVECLTGKTVASEEVKDGVASFRFSNYLPSGELLVERFRKAVANCEWVVLFTGCSFCPEAVLEMFQYVCSRHFSSPRIVVVGEKTDVRHGNDKMMGLFSLGKLVNLTAEPVWKTPWPTA